MRARSIALLVGAAAGLGVAVASRGPSLVPWPPMVRRAFPLVLGTAAGLGAGAVTGAGATTIRLIADVGGDRGHAGSDGQPRRAKAVLMATGLAALISAATIGGRLGVRRLLEGMEAESAGVDPSFAEGPRDPLVSGSPESAVPALTLGREGARLVGTVVTTEQIEEATGRPARCSPIRVFVGVDAALTVPDRVDLAMIELRRTGAFDRSHLLIQAPAGTGYANATPVDALELLTFGDCATVAVAYGLLPSFLSLGKVPVAARTQRLLIEAIAAEVADRALRPRILLYGESLGAKVQQTAIPGGLADLERFGISAALWVGTPGSVPADAFARRCQGSSMKVDHPEQVSNPLPVPRPRVWFLEHDADPVVRFRPELIRIRPDWLPVDGSRGRNIPTELTWKPVITWAQALVDTVFATDVKPGEFQSRGHDYRADLGVMVRTAFDLPADDSTAARLEVQLRALERSRAARIAES